MRPLGFLITKVHTKYEVCISSSFEGMFDRMRKF